MTEHHSLNDQELLEASSRVALSAYLHDLGKLGERARIAASDEQIESNVHLYCPYNEEKKFHSHKHAAYTGLCIDELEPLLPKLVGSEMFPFAGWKSRNADDSLINAAAAHHRPNSFLQWITATADRIASGFERDQFEQYNKAEEKNHYRTRLVSLFEEIHQDKAPSIDQLNYRYPLAPLNARSVFPVSRQQAEPEDNATAQKEYQQLWSYLKEGLAKIPASHRKSLPLWLDHFDSLWLCATQAIPSATAFNARPDVSLYDHSKTTAALATALWRYHHERGDDEKSVTTAMQYRQDWSDEKFLLIQGDFFGIQDFIFASGGHTNKYANKLLRGKSFYVSLLTEMAALRILEALSLPSTSQITNAAGKFMIVAPNTEATRDKLDQVRAEFDLWFRQHTFNVAGLGIATTPACPDDFIGQDEQGKSRFRNLISRLFAQLEIAKFQRLNLAQQPAENAILQEFLPQFGELGVCQIDGRSPAATTRDSVPVSWLAHDQIKIGTMLARPEKQRLLITRESGLHDKLKLDLFGYYVSFTGNTDESGEFGALAKSGALLRCWDIALPQLDETDLYQGSAKRFINGYVPVFPQRDGYETERYGAELAAEVEIGQLKTLEHIACEDRSCPNSPDQWLGIKALHALKGDVDDLGLLFEAGLKEPTFAKMASLSRQVNLFFSLWLPAYCAKHYPNTYTVFAGGDDFFLIGSWKSTTELSLKMHEHFARYVAANPGIHFSAGLLQVKAGVPVRFLSEGAEQALENAKAYQAKESGQRKNAVSVYGQVMPWSELAPIIDCAGLINHLREHEGAPLSTAYLYGLLELADMAGVAHIKPEAGLWRSYLTYRTQRNVGDKVMKRPEESKEEYHARKQKLAGMVLEILTRQLQTHQSRFKVAVHHLLYQFRVRS